MKLHIVSIPDFLIFTSDTEPDPNGGDRVSQTNCTTNDLYWYPNEKGYLENRLHQDRTLFDIENSVSVFKEAYEESEENIRVSAANYEVEKNRRRETIANLRNEFRREVPRLDQMISDAESKLEENYQSKLEDLDESSRHNYLFYIMGFIIFIILILF